MTIKEITIIIISALLIGIGGCLLLKHAKKIDTSIKSTVLPTNDKEKIIINPDNHTIEVIKPGSDKKTYLPDHPVSITEDKNGNLTIQERTWGFEHNPYAGLGFSNGFRAHVGVDWFYFHKFDSGIGLMTDCQHLNKTAADLNLSYNFYHNTSLAVSYSSSKMAGVFLKIRF